MHEKCLKCLKCLSSSTCNHCFSAHRSARRRTRVTHVILCNSCALTCGRLHLSVAVNVQKSDALHIVVYLGTGNTFATFGTHPGHAPLSPNETRPSFERDPAPNETTLESRRNSTHRPSLLLVVAQYPLHFVVKSLLRHSADHLARILHSTLFCTPSCSHGLFKTSSVV